MIDVAGSRTPVSIGRVILAHPDPLVRQTGIKAENGEVSFITLKDQAAPAGSWAKVVTGGELRKAAEDIASKPVNGETLLILCSALTHLGLANIASTLEQLRTIRTDYLAVALPEEPVFGPALPSDRWPSAYLPQATWFRLFNEAGFDIIETPADEKTRSQDAATLEKMFGVRGVQSLPAAASRGTYIVMRQAYAFLKPDRNERIEKWLDIGYRRIKREQLLPMAGRIGFNVLMFQDFINLRPLIEIIGPSDGVVFLRRGMMPPDAHAAISRALERMSIPKIEFNRVRELKLKALDLQFLVSVTEGSLSVNHALGRQLVEAANINGIATLLLQHGIRVPSPTERTLEFGSDYHISWGSRNSGSLFGLHDVVGTQVPLSVERDGQDHALGSPKLSDSLINPNPSVVRDRLGIDAAKYRGVVLLGTKLPEDAADASRMIQTFNSIINSNTDLFFLIKPHPKERRSQYGAFSHPNALIIDDLLMIAMDLSISRILNGVDIVLCSLSTLLLDAAVAGKPFIQYDTGGRDRFEHCDAIPLAEMSSILKNKLPVSRPSDEMFRRFYADAEDGGFYSRFRDFIRLIGSRKRSSLDQALVNYSMCSMVEELWLRLARRG